MLPYVAPFAHPPSTACSVVLPFVVLSPMSSVLALWFSPMSSEERLHGPLFAPPPNTLARSLPLAPAPFTLSAVSSATRPAPLASLSLSPAASPPVPRLIPRLSLTSLPPLLSLS